MLAFSLAMLSKGSVGILPVILLGIIVWRRQLTLWDLARMTPFIVMAIALTVVNIWCQNRGLSEAIRSASLAQRLAGAGAVVWFYLSNALVPIDLIFVYPQWRIQTDEMMWWLPLLAAVAVTAVLWRQRRHRPLLFAWGFYCAALVPVLGFTDVGFMQHSLVANHYQHIALLGIAAAVAAAWSTWHTTALRALRAAATAMAAAAVCSLALVTLNHIRLLSDPLELYRALLDRNPDSWMLHNELGNVLLTNGRPAEAISQFGEALRLKSDYPEAHNGWGVALYNKNKIPDAMYHFQEAIYLNSGFADAYFNRGNALFKTNRFEEAVAQYTEALRLNPYYIDAHVNLGTALATMGRLQQAVEQFELALQLEPDNLKVYSNLTTAYAQMHEPAKAIAAALKALSLARSEGQTDLALSIEAWLTNYLAQQPNSQNAQP